MAHDHDEATLRAWADAPEDSGEFSRLIELVVDGDGMAFAAAFRLPWPFSQTVLPGGRIRIESEHVAERSPA